MTNSSEDIRRKVFDLIKCALWGADPVDLDEAVFEEMKQHALIALPAGVIASLRMPEDLRQAWQEAIYQQIAYHVRCRHAQASLPITVPYAVLKGTSAAQYYPHRECRMLGDIDIMPRREDFVTACNMLLQAGYAESEDAFAGKAVRHRSFTKGGIDVEVHAYFAILNDPAQARFLDDTIIGGICPSHVLPDPVNGLVLLEHINQHLEEGIGLRQILDWMMFVSRCLPDEQWGDFRVMAQRCGLETLAVTVTRMCGMYLGLPHRSWCEAADETLCADLMDYIMSSGNFGKKKDYDTRHSEHLLSIMRTPGSAFSLLQRYGLHNWPASQRHPILRPFAWIYQLGRFVRLTLRRHVSLRQVLSEHSTARDRNALLDRLGAVQTSKGLVKYDHGEYIKS